MSHKVFDQIAQSVSQRAPRLTLNTWFPGSEFHILDKIKNFSAKIYKSAGYNEYPFMNFDPWSIWFYVTDRDGNIQAATRLVEKRDDNLVPIEFALLNFPLHEEEMERAEDYIKFAPNIRYAIVKTNSADWNSVSFRPTVLGLRAMKMCASAVAKYCLTKGFEIVYGLINPEWLGLHRVYLDYGAKESDEFPNLVYYPHCKLKGRVSKFRIIEMHKSSLQYLAKNIV
ncbi:hypothetical protein LEP1GSC058_0287 [Leptospira fainei serovar Hurstbridge str. BUT 6]|uniref:N-acetyltransferase domain-containing protein n=1 Tax=Leptospira fainei serovar Hurstbridge str. BUT 6 TaxID=1193011 RepID=S3UQ07_9LEPT|nr:hypothetical protein [Leptospira fainei]EPG72486.1 hypothetical protein LEP1GSC058_0287 [Leptospira fainei serovar Hurstbridge str. BUT 6]